MKKIQFVRSRFLIPMSEKMGLATRIEDGYVLYQSGKILESGKFTAAVADKISRKYRGQLEIIKGSQSENLDVNPKTSSFFLHDAIMLPGFVKAHGHDHESPIIGLVKDEPLTTWLDDAVNLFTRFISDNHRRLSSLYGKSPNYVAYAKARLDDIYYGITSNMVHHCNYNKYNVDDIVAVNEKSGTKMIIAVGSQDRNYYEKILDIPVSRATDRLDSYHEKYSHLTMTRIIPGPDQGFSNGPELLKALKRWADEHGTLIHCHSSEEFNTTTWFRKEYGMTPVEYFNSIGFLDSNTVLAHQVHCTDRDLDILAETGTKVVHNPLANTILGSGMPPVVEMLKRGIPVAISTDGSGSADNQNILSAARLASQYQKALHMDAHLLPAQKVLEMITIEPARILGLNCGALESGKDADIILLDASRPNLTPCKVSNVVENLIWASDGSEVTHVISKGRMLFSNNTYRTLDAGTILEQVQDLSDKFDRYRKKASKITGTGVHK